MRVSLTTGAIVFFAVVAAIAAAATAYVIAWTVRKLQRRKEPERSTLAKWTRRDVLGLAVGGAGCIAWGGLFEPYRLEVTRTRILSPKLSPADRPVRMVHISDLHCDPKARNEPELPRIIKSLNPDLIVYTGDSINSIEGLPNFRRCLTKLGKIAPVYAVRGNWDVRINVLPDYFEDIDNVTELNGTNQLIEVAGTRLWVCGATVMDGLNEKRREDLLKQATSEIPEEDFTVFLYHYPDLLQDLLDLDLDLGIDLQCAGHTHGGQVALPIYGSLVTVSKHGKKFEAGLYKLAADKHLYVNRGIGMEGHAPRVRFWCRPEISLIELAPNGVSATDKRG